MIGRTVSHFKIIAKLGEGGMGEVYRAKDTKLGREVAFKVLPEEMASDPGRLSRFQREAKTVAAMNHPNIVTIYSVAEADGVHFLTMELVSGKTLDDLLPTGGFSLDRFLALATPIADAVVSAHSEGIIHRDLKPANVMVTDKGDRVKVLDFGLAKLSADVAADDRSQFTTLAQTQAGLTVGTPHYMSPEQVRGKTVDHRSDIFSLGVMLYEMATGKRPFQGASAIELMSSVLKDTPPVLTEAKPELPRHLGRVIGRCLERSPADRYQTARDVYNALKGLREETSSPESAAHRETATSSAGANRSPDSVATAGSDRAGTKRVFGISVLPIESDPEDQELGTLARGLAEDVAAGLATFAYLSVSELGPGSNQPAADSDVRQTAKRLGVRYLLTGSLRRVGETIRLSVRLLDALEGERLWSETYDRSSPEMARIELQDQLIDRIVATVADSAGVLVHSIAERLWSMPIDELRGGDWVVRTFAYWDQLRPEEHADLRAGLEQAVDRHPADSSIWSCLAQVYLDEHRVGFNPRGDGLGRALAAAQRAVELDSRNSTKISSGRWRSL
jgi:serine/threonine protein kinase